MKPDQTLEVIDVGTLEDRVRAMRARGRRLVQICATSLPGQFELTCSFDLDGHLARFERSARRPGRRTGARA